MTRPRRAACLVFAGALALAAAEAQPAEGGAPIRIVIGNFVVTPKFLAPRGGAPLSKWYVSMRNPYTGTFDYSNIVPHYGCKSSAVRHPKIVVSGKIALVGGVTYQAQYQPSNRTTWTPITNLAPAGDGSFAANYFDVDTACPTRNLNFRIVGTDGTSTYESRVVHLGVQPAFSGGNGPRQPPAYHVGTVKWFKFKVADPEIRNLRVSTAHSRRPDAAHRWRVTPRTRWRYLRTLHLVGGRTVLRFRFPDHRTYVFRVCNNATSRHAPFCQFWAIWLGM